MSNGIPKGLQRRLWLLRIPGLLAVLLIFSGEQWALLWLYLEGWLVISAFIAVLWMPARVVADLPRPDLSTRNMLQLLLYSLVDCVALVLVWLLLALAMDRKTIEGKEI